MSKTPKPGITGDDGHQQTSAPATSQTTASSEKAIVRTLSDREELVNASIQKLMEERYREMKRENAYTYNNIGGDLTTLLNLSLKEKRWLKVVNIPGFGECTTNRQFFSHNRDGVLVDTTFSSMKGKDGSIDVANLTKDTEFEHYADWFKNNTNISGLHIMSNERTLQLLNIIAKACGIKENIDSNYISKQRSFYQSSETVRYSSPDVAGIISLDSNSELARLGAALYMIFGNCSIPIPANNGKYLILDCSFIGCRLLDTFFRDAEVSPLIEVDVDHS